MPPMASDTLVIVPTYNERENLEALATEVLARLPTADLLIVDDNSPDGTGALAEALRAREPRIEVVHRPGKLGLGTAYLAGFRHGLARGYDYLVEMDCDFSHDPQYLPALIERARAGADLVLGSRYVAEGGTRNWSWSRRAISRGGNLYARAVLGLPIEDLTGGFKCFRRAVLEQVGLDEVRSEGYAFQIELTYRAWRRGFRIEELPIVFVDRRVGQSKMSRRIVGEAVWMVWRVRWALRRG